MIGAPGGCAPREIRTPVLGLKGPRPSPLDDGGELDENSIIGTLSGQAAVMSRLTISIHRSYCARLLRAYPI